MYAVIFIGYWAYGSKTSSYLLNSVSGPVWVKTIANLAAFLQTVIALHVLIFFPRFYFFISLHAAQGIKSKCF